MYFSTELQEIQTLLLCVVFKYLDERMQKGELLLNIVFIGTAQCGVQIMKEPKVKVSQNFAVIFFGGLPQNKKNPTCKAVPRAYSDQRATAGHTWNTPKKVFFSD